jgi:hypothetical protein
MASQLDPAVKECSKSQRVKESKSQREPTHLRRRPVPRLAVALRLHGVVAAWRVAWGSHGGLHGVSEGLVVGVCSLAGRLRCPSAAWLRCLHLALLLLAQSPRPI